MTLSPCCIECGWPTGKLERVTSASGAEGMLHPGPCPSLERALKVSLLTIRWVERAIEGESLMVLR